MCISIIIPTRNRTGDLIRCLQSLIIQSIKPDEILVIDSSETPIISEQKFQNLTTQLNKNNITLIYKHTSPGAAYQRNVAIPLAHGDIFYFFDDDVILESNYIQEMQKIFEKFPQYYGGMGTVNGPRSTFSINRLLRILFFMQRDNASGTFTFSGMPTHSYGKTTFQEVEVLGGCGMVYRAQAFKEQLFDENLGKYSYMEDCDLSKRVSRNHKLFYTPTARLDHLKSPLSRDNIIQNRAIFIINYSYLFFKNFYPENKLKILGYWWTVTGLFIEALVLIRSLDYLRGYIRGLQEHFGCKFWLL
jgi:GT2 family glycosyltransferase